MGRGPGLAIAAACFLTVSPIAQQPPGPPQPDRIMIAAEKSAVIEGALQRLQKAYVFPEAAKKMEEAVRARVARKEYDGIASTLALAKMLTEHLQVSRDRHLRVIYNAEGFPDRRGDPTPEERARFVENARRLNFGFERVERLPGNVGYLDLRAFDGMPDGSETGHAAMKTT
ncbi:MAG TPA: hypothetical protein VK886_12125 [Vicinamibacterales bacterium]|nr:hypothetical protein [Vicinamibacterales bacterium]